LATQMGFEKARRMDGGMVSDWVSRKGFEKAWRRGEGMVCDWASMKDPAMGPLTAVLMVPAMDSH
jgi:hypothetical protein